MSALDINNTRDLEDLCINTIYANLLKGKLSPHTQTFQITSCTSRDLAPSTHDYTGMIATLTQWSTQCDLVLAEIAGRVRDVRAAAAERKRVDEEYERELEEKRGGKKGKEPGTGGKKGKEKADVWFGGDEIMADVEEPGMEGGSGVGVVGGGGESPSGRKRKLVRPR